MDMEQCVYGTKVIEPHFGLGKLGNRWRESGLVTVYFENDDSESKRFGRMIRPDKLTVATVPAEAELDKAAAIKLLERHGYAFRIWGPEEVQQAVRAAWGGSNGYRQPDYDVDTHMDKIVAHIMGTDDWKEYMSSPAMAQENVMDRLIDGVVNDHPEWFPETYEADIDHMISRGMR